MKSIIIKKVNLKYIKVFGCDAYYKDLFQKKNEIR